MSKHDHWTVKAAHRVPRGTALLDHAGETEEERQHREWWEGERRRIAATVHPLGRTFEAWKTEKVLLDNLRQMMATRRGR